jgi:hypothetical protein
MSEVTPSSNTAQQLPPPDAALIAILLDASLERLEFLHATLPKVTVAVQHDELTQFVGEQIGAVIKEQRSLEDEYDRLMEERKRLMEHGPEKKQELLQIHRQVEEVKMKLRSSNATLTRSLKENPNVRDNQNKLIAERVALMTIIADCVKAVNTTGNYASLVERIKHEETDLNKLVTVKNRLSALEEEIDQLDREFRDEKNKMKTEDAAYLADYKEMKDELDKHRISADIELDYFARRLQTQRETLRLELQSAAEVFAVRNVTVKTQIESEQVVHEQTKLFFARTIDNLNSDKALWVDRVETQAKHLEEDVLPSLKARRAEVEAELEKFRLRKTRRDHQVAEDMENANLAKQALTKRLAANAELDKAVVLLQTMTRRFLVTKEAGKKKKKK